jgi:predicted nuclease of restriction endonuclease-like RecB superfamily
MLTGKLVRVRQRQGRIVPSYLDTADTEWLESAARLLELFRASQQRTRGEIESEIQELFGDDPLRIVYQGLAKLLEDRCDFETVSEAPPERLREKVFQIAASHRTAVTEALVRRPFDRHQVVEEVAEGLGLTPEAVDKGLFADLKSQEHLIHFKDLAPERLLERYNVGLAQAVLLRSTRVRVLIHSESPQRYRQLLRIAKFHRLICEIQRDTALLPSGERRGTRGDSYRLVLDGPLSLFTATHKYGVQLAMFLPSILHCREFELEADLLWGPQKKPKSFVLTSADGLVSHLAQTGMYVPPELKMFVNLFRKQVTEWTIDEETEIVPLADGFWVPDFRLTSPLSGRTVLLEVLGFWRRSSAQRHLERLRKHVAQPFLLAVSDKLCIDDEDLETLPAGVHRFRQMPLPEEIARLADEIVR